MAKRYTAQEIRAAVQKSICEDNIAEMLLQYADELEREKRYEYGVSASYGVDVYSSLELVRRVARGNARVVRREVGEWEPVPGGDGE